MTQSDERLLADYFKTKSDIEALTERLELQKGFVIALLRNEPDNKIENSVAKFAIRKTTSYSFSSNVDAGEKKLDEVKTYVNGLKKMEIENGIAQIVTESETLVMTKNK